jgi:hypothetical protein
MMENHTDILLERNILPPVRKLTNPQDRTAVENFKAALLNEWNKLCKRRSDLENETVTELSFASMEVELSSVNDCIYKIRFYYSLLCYIDPRGDKNARGAEGRDSILGFNVAYFLDPDPSHPASEAARSSEEREEGPTGLSESIMVPVDEEDDIPSSTSETQAENQDDSAD